jgi:TolB-like protein/DNA-binding winged helix-turn-helix (wHTH) protein/tetratricopeptide (TPR) repeat protein
MTDRVYRFAQFELNPGTGELRKGSSVVSLQEKPLLLLAALLDHPLRVVTREQLRLRMWDSRTVVEYDQGINAAIKKVRDALGDSADRPRLIETVAKRGYRLLVPASVVTVDAAGVDAPAADASRGAPIAQSPAVVAETTAAQTSAPALATPPAITTAPISRGTRFLRGRWIASLAGVAVLASVALWLYVTEIRPVGPTQFRSLAVLPLQDLSPGGGNEYFADGITEEITTNLAQTLPLRVISRTSVMQYKRTSKPITRIARELGVEAIVEGSVARSGNRVSVTVQLIDATDDRHLWAEKYERRVEDIMAIEAELSQAIANQVSGTLARQRPPRAVRRVDPQVHELCLLGRYHWNKRTETDLAKAEEYFQRAIAIDASYAPAHAGLADVYALQPFYGTGTFADRSPKAVAAAERALALDDSLAEARATLGLVKVSSREWRTAADEFRRAIELNPNYATAHHWYSYYLRFANRLNEACAELETARQLDPLSAIINADQGEMLNAARRYAEAKVSLRRAMELAPNLGRPHALMSVAELATGRTEEAVQEARAALAFDPQNPATIAHAGFTFAVGGQTTEAVQLLERLKDMAKRDINISMYAAMIEAGLGRRDEALATLEQQASSPSSAVLQGIQFWYAFQPLRAEPRFRQVLSQSW